MAAELGSSQISALLESVPGIANVLRSPVADAMVNMIRAGAGGAPVAYDDAEELVQYAVRRGLISADEGDRVLGDVKGKGRGRAKAKGQATGRAAARKPARKTAKRAPARKKVTKRPVKKAAARKRR